MPAVGSHSPFAHYVPTALPEEDVPMLLYIALTLLGALFGMFNYYGPTA